MSSPAVTVSLVPLVPNLILPQPASAQTRAHVPAGYGVQEQCLPFTAASALGFVIPSPIRFGLCPLPEVPRGCHAFRSPLDRPAADGQFADSPVNLVLGKPPGRSSVHVAAGDPVAHAILIPRHLRRALMEVVPTHARMSRDTRKAVAAWDQQHAGDRSSYKMLARSRHGRL